MMIYHASRNGFTIIELVIVAVIIVIIGTIAAVRVGGAAERGSQAALIADLEALQKAIDHYAAEHHGQYPTETDIAGQLTKYTDVFGGVSDAPTATHIYGPYLNRIPAMPYGQYKGNDVIATASGPEVGWLYHPPTGRIGPHVGETELTDGVTINKLRTEELKSLR